MRLKKQKALLFDFDGTLVNSQPIIEEFMNSLYEKYNITLAKEEKYVTNGMSIKDFARWLSEHKHIQLSSKDITVTDPNYLERIQLFPEARAALAQLKAQGFQLALVTNSPRAYVNWLLRKYNLESYFSTTITVDESLVSKPDPTMLRMAAENLRIPVYECIMIDDNPPGIEAGNSLGMTTIRIGEKKEKANYALTTVSAVPALIKKIWFTPQ